MPCLIRGKGKRSRSGNHCRYKKCPGLKIKRKTIRAYRTIYQCEQCTIEKGTPFWLCHTTKMIDGTNTVVSCHLRYHAEREKKEIIVTATTEGTVISDLTDES
jgi:hypothetical protein